MSSKGGFLFFAYRRQIWMSPELVSSKGGFLFFAYRRQIWMSPELMSSKGGFLFFAYRRQILVLHIFIMKHLQKNEQR
jgi:hypothetical protein